MIRKYGFESYESAEQTALTFLFEQWQKVASTGETFETTTHKGKGVAYIKANKTGEVACLFNMSDTKENYSLFILMAKEADKENRTYPFRDVREDMLPFLLALRVCFFRPVVEITPDEALTPKGLQEVFSFFGDEQIGGDFMTLDQWRNGGHSYEDSFTRFDPDTLQMNWPVIPKELERATGTKIKNASDYVKATAKLMGVALTDEEAKAVREAYLFNASLAFVMWATYELFRTEDYFHLTAALAQYGRFGLPKDWQKYSLLRGERLRAEEYALSVYVNCRSNVILTNERTAQEICDYLKAPKGVLIRARRNKYPLM